MDLERAEDVLTVRFFPVEDRENPLPDVQVNIGVVNGTSPAEWDTPSDPGEWDPVEVACAVREALSPVIEAAWRKYEADH